MAAVVEISVPLNAILGDDAVALQLRGPVRIGPARLAISGGGAKDLDPTAPCAAELPFLTSHLAHLDWRESLRIPETLLETCQGPWRALGIRTP